MLIRSICHLTCPEFRTFVECMRSIAGIEQFGANVDVPLSDQYAQHKCFLNETKFPELKRLDYYQKDPGFKLEISGWKCAACGIYISEAGRAEKKLGGPAGKSLAKTKCPPNARKSLVVCQPTSWLRRLRPRHPQQTPLQPNKKRRQPDVPDQLEITSLASIMDAVKCFDERIEPSSGIESSICVKVSPHRCARSSWP